MTYVNAAGVAEAVRPHTELMFRPNRILNFTGLGDGVTSRCPAAPRLSGFTLLSTTTGVSAVLVSGIGGLVVTQCVVFDVNAFAFQAADGGVLRTASIASRVVHAPTS